MKRNLKILLSVIAIIIVGIMGLLLTNPYIPTTIAFGTEDLEARNKFEEIARSHGYDFRYEKNINNETYVVIDSITPREYRKIDCEYFRWSSNKSRKQGVIVYDREECSL
jgi:hypothetical protein